MNVDNFNILKKYFSNDQNTYLLCLIIRRRKDNSNLTNKVIRSYFVEDYDQLSFLREEIILLCKHYNARAYLSICEKSFLVFQKALLKTLADLNVTGDLVKPYNLLVSVSERIKSTTKRWIVDIDDINNLEEIKNYLNDKVIEIIPTVNGKHLITQPFPRNEFNEKFPNIDIHTKSAKTLLYYYDNE